MVNFGVLYNKDLRSTIEYTIEISSESSCPSDCQRQGKCYFNKCICDRGYTDIDCSQGI